MKRGPGVLNFRGFMVWCAIVAGIGGFGANADASGSATFICSAAPTHVCVFSIPRFPGGMRGFTLRGQQRAVVPGLAVGSDIYLETLDQPMPRNIASCLAAKPPCKTAVIQRGVNQ
jgi:hypothetical protein